jgi:hypothetical protein
MKKRVVFACVALLCASVGSGCVQVHQLVKMEHDGSGEFVERVKILPRAVRLLERKKGVGAGKEHTFGLLSDEALSERIKAYGEMTLKSKKAEKLPDGSHQIEVVCTFKDVNKIRLFVIPTLKTVDKKMTGKLRLQYARIGDVWGRGKCHIDQVSFHPEACHAKGKYVSPATVEKYRRAFPVFADMIRDFRFKIEVQAPDDVESFEDRSMLIGIRAEGNRAIPLDLKGENIIRNPRILEMFATGEMAGGRVWKRLEQSVPRTVTPIAARMGVRFLKATEVKK